METIKVPNTEIEIDYFDYRDGAKYILYTEYGNKVVLVSESKEDLIAQLKAIIESIENFKEGREESPV